MFENPIVNLVSPLPSYPFIGRIRHSDINIDGFPDLFLTLQFANTKLNTSYDESYVLISTACTEPGALCNTQAGTRRYFDRNSEDIDVAKITSLAGPNS